MSHHRDHDSTTMRFMMIFCAVPLVIVLFSTGATGGYRWFAIAAIGVFIVGHFLLMRKGHHGISSSEDEEKNVESKADEQKRHSCH